MKMSLLVPQLFHAYRQTDGTILIVALQGFEYV
jgi:hypothetical protein